MDLVVPAPFNAFQLSPVCYQSRSPLLRQARIALICLPHKIESKTFVSEKGADYIGLS